MTLMFSIEYPHHTSTTQAPRPIDLTRRRAAGQAAHLRTYGYAPFSLPPSLVCAHIR